MDGVAVDGVAVVGVAVGEIVGGTVVGVNVSVVGLSVVGLSVVGLAIAGVDGVGARLGVNVDQPLLFAEDNKFGIKMHANSGYTDTHTCMHALQTESTLGVNMCTTMSFVEATSDFSGGVPTIYTHMYTYIYGDGR